MALRNNASVVEKIPRIDLVLDELNAILSVFVAELTNFNSLASVPQVRQTLGLISKCADISEDEIELLNPGVRELLAIHYPGGRERFAPGIVKADDVRSAARMALDALPVPGRGRPVGSKNHAARRLARELARLFENNSPFRPARSVIVSKSLDLSIPNTRAGGRFLKFFKLVIEALPLDMRVQLVKTGCGIDALVKSAILPK